MKPALCLQSTLFTELTHNKYLAVIILASVSGSCWNIDFEVRTCALTETLATTQLQSRVASAPRERENRIKNGKSLEIFKSSKLERLSESGLTQRQSMPCIPSE